MNKIRILNQQDVLELMTVRDALLADEKAYCRKKDSPIFFEKEVAGNKTFRYSTVAEHHDELSK